MVGERLFSVVQEERIDSSGVENSRKRIIKSNHVENHVEKTFKLSKEGFNLATSVLHGVITRAVRGCDENKVRTIIKDGYLDM